MARTATYYECDSCGYNSPKWLGLCPTCSEWHTFREKVAEKEIRRHVVEIPTTGQEGSEPISLSEIDPSRGKRIGTGIGELDRVLGGGLVPGSLILLGGDPGIGKSTLMLQIARSSPSLNLLYVAGEESPGQIRQRADRIVAGQSNMKILATTEVDQIVTAVQKERPDLLIIDSIQTVYRSRLDGLPGSVQQIRECAALFQQLAKKDGITTILVGHVTKDGEIAGPRILEHMVDTVLQFEGDRSRLHRLLRGVKNRFGSAQEVGVFEMDDRGLHEVNNPSSLFLSEMDQTLSGNAVTCIMEGSRPLLVEVQALVTPTGYGTPQRTAAGFDQRKLSLLLAVLEKRAGFRFSGQDVFLNVAGGLKVSDTAADLAVACALASSYQDKPLLPGLLVMGEVGLGGEIRLVSHLQQRLQEGERMGFKTALVPGRAKISDGNLTPINGRYLSDAIRSVLDGSQIRKNG